MEQPGPAWYVLSWDLPAILIMYCRRTPQSHDGRRIPWVRYTSGVHDHAQHLVRMPYFIRSSAADSPSTIVRAMTQDTDIYPEPEKYKPERFECMAPRKAETMDPRNMVFGFGRRCARTLYLHNSSSDKIVQSVPRAALRRRECLPRRRGHDRDSRHTQSAG